MRPSPKARLAAERYQPPWILWIRTILRLAGRGPSHSGPWLQAIWRGLRSSPRGTSSECRHPPTLNDASGEAQSMRGLIGEQTVKFLFHHFIALAYALFQAWTIQDG